MRQHTHWKWHLDEVYVKINGVQHYLWRAVDHEGEVLESFVTKMRDKAAALKFIKKALKRHGRIKAVVTDRLRSYGAALKEIGAADLQQTGRRLNNRAENSHLPFRRRERAILRFRKMKTLQNSAPSTPPSTITSIRNATSSAGKNIEPAAPPHLLSGSPLSPEVQAPCPTLVQVETSCRWTDSTMAAAQNRARQPGEAWLEFFGLTTPVRVFRRQFKGHCQRKWVHVPGPIQPSQSPTGRSAGRTQGGGGSQGDGSVDGLQIRGRVTF